MVAVMLELETITKFYFAEEISALEEADNNPEFTFRLKVRCVWP